MRRRVVTPLVSALPRGGELPARAFEARHRVLLALLWLHVPVLFLVALAYDSPLGHAALHPLPVVAFALAAWRLGGRRPRATASALGLLTCSALLVHGMEGLIEAHFHFFVVLTVLALYEDWAVYGLALGYVVVHHGLAGAGLPYRVFDHEGADAPGQALAWAGLHGLFFGLAVAASLALWRQNEGVRDTAVAELRGRVHAEAVAEALARGLRPDELPEVPGVELAARYEPGEGSVGGDWYDVIPLEDGRLLVALGDAAGRGPDAAGLSARLRHVLRAYAEDGAGPAELLARLDRTIGDSAATVACLLVDCPRTAVTYAVAGHVAPLIRDPDGSVRALDQARTMPLAGLGVPRDEATEVIAPGATILLFSDGLVERRHEPLDHGLGRLSRAMGRIGGDPAELAGALVEHVGQPVTSDDVALLALRCDPDGARAAVDPALAA